MPNQENQENLVTAQNLETAEDRMTLAYDKKIILADESEWRGTAGLDPENLSLWIWLDEGYEMSEVFIAFRGTDDTIVGWKEVNWRSLRPWSNPNWIMTCSLRNMKVTLIWSISSFVIERSASG